MLPTKYGRKHPAMCFRLYKHSTVFVFELIQERDTDGRFGSDGWFSCGAEIAPNAKASEDKKI